MEPNSHLRARTSRSDRRTAERRRVLAALTCGDMAYAFQQTAIIPALTQVGQDLHTKATWTSWLLTGYLVITSVAAPMGGKLGDLYGKDRTLVTALAIYFLGCIGAALAPSIAPLIIFRSLQGVGGAIFPLSIAIVRDYSSTEETPFNVGSLTAAFGAGGTIGYGVSGVIVEALSWRYIFAVGAFVVLAGAVVVRAGVSHTSPKPQLSLDVPGGLMLAGGFIFILCALTVGPDLGWSSPWIALIFAAGFTSLGLYVRREMKTEYPLLDLKVLSQPVVALTNAASFTAGYVLFTTYLLILHFAQGAPASVARAHPEARYGFSADPIGVGLLLICASAGLIAGGFGSGTIVRRIGPRWIMLTGMAALASGVVSLTLLRSSPWAMGSDLFAIGLGYGLAMGSASTLILNSVQQDQAGAATGINSVLRLVGGGIGGQIGVAILAAVAIAGTQVPAASAFQTAFWVEVGVAVLGLLCTTMLVFQPVERG